MSRVEGVSIKSSKSERRACVLRWRQDDTGDVRDMRRGSQADMRAGAREAVSETTAETLWRLWMSRGRGEV